MTVQHSITVFGGARRESAMKSRATYTVEILRDDICWLENRIRTLQSIDGASERMLADYYQKLLHQRKRQLTVSGRTDGACAGCWDAFFS